jgi:predicted nuclease of predicted toxin-antitoxin system
MKFLLDQDVYATTGRFLTGSGHDVVPVGQLGLLRATDEELLHVARELGRILVTRDRDYGNLVFVKGSGTGVVYLRMSPDTHEVVHSELDRVFALYPEEELLTVFVVVEPGGHRIRRLVPSP